MIFVSSLIFLIIIIVVAFAPSLAYMAIVRNTERYEREPWRAVLKSFLWGATFGVILAFIFELIATTLYAQNTGFFRQYEILAEHKNSIDVIILAAVIAPFVEEATKALGIIISNRYIDEIEDGIVYGASSGFGFAATENLLYEVVALIKGGVAAWIAVSIIRSISSALLHGSATAITGFGYSSSKIADKGSMKKGYLTAVGMHSSFNILASIPIIFSGEEPALYLIPLALAIIFAASAFTYIRKKIRLYDRPLRRGRRMR